MEAAFKQAALDCGFDLVGIASLAAPPPRLGQLVDWLEQGRQAGMGWMQRQAEKRLDPGRVLEGAKSMLCVGLVYNTQHPYSTQSDPDKAWVSRYAWGDDYHEVMDQKLEALEARLKALAPEASFRRYCDTGPVSEKAWASQAGLGWQGKHTNLINKEKGSWFFLGEILMTLDLAPDEPAVDHCGTCSRCLDACPTQAFPKAYELDASKCISYLSIEKRGDLEPAEAQGLGRQVYGCDICQDVCPWNRGASLSQEPAFEPRPGLLAPDRAQLEAWLTQDEATFAAAFQGSAMKRAKQAGLKRNAQAVIKNISSPASPSSRPRA